MRHRFHALCPYFAMFPESFAETWLERLTKPGDIVLDPFSGRGTLPFQALLMGRRAVATDINPVAFCISKAKCRAPSAKALRQRLTRLEQEFEGASWEPARRAMPEFFHVAFRPKALRQLLFLRDRLRWRSSDTDCMLAALVLGSLHGESERSPSYFSNQMPHTISTKPAYSVQFWEERGLVAPERDAFELLRDRVDYRYKSEVPAEQGFVFEADMRDLPRLKGLPTPISCAITSPPYYDVTSYEEDQWLRLWFLGGPPHPTYRTISRDDRHENLDSYWRLIGDMWRTFGQVLAPSAAVVVRIGAVRLTPQQLVDGLEGTAVLSGRNVRLVATEVSAFPKRQTDTFRPGSKGCKVEVDCHFELRAARVAHPRNRAA